MRFVILHYHIFKNAGTSLEDILDHNFSGRFARFDGPDRNTRVDNTWLLSFLTRNPHLQAISSHQIRYPVPAASGFVFFDACFLRDPLDRVRSMYDYVREKPDERDPLSDLALNLDLSGFVERMLSDMPDWICDVQTRLLAGRGTPVDTRLDRAMQTMLRTSFLGVVDRFEESLTAGEFFLRAAFPGLRCRTAVVNASRGLEGTLEDRKRRLREACGEILYKDLVHRNASDLQLVERARLEVERRFRIASAESSRPPGLEADRILSFRKSDVAVLAR
jgi:hypothetical protein